MLYHGTENVSALGLMQPSPPMLHSIDLSRCRRLTDFGRGFYLTTVLKQAENWADMQFRNRRKKTHPSTEAVVLRFDVDRNQLAFLFSLSFVTDQSNSDFWDFVAYCRSGMSPHLLRGNRDYDVVFGPVSLWSQRLVIKDSDQISFHTQAALKILPTPALHIVEEIQPITWRYNDGPSKKDTFTPSSEPCR